MKFKDNENYKKIQAHVNELLKSAEPSFSANYKDYALFLTYLIAANDNDYAIHVTNINNNILLLLNEPHRFWLNTKVRTPNQEEISLKRNVIRYMVLLELEIYFNQNNSKFSNRNEIDHFIKEQKNKFEKILD